MAASLDPIDCSAQPLDLSFHPKYEYIMAAALVDGTVEVHDFTPTKNKSDDGGGDNDDDENDTIVSSVHVHKSLLPHNTNSQEHQRHQASCRAVRFSSDGSTLYTGGSGGDVSWLDAETVCQLSTTSASPKGRFVQKYNAINTLHQLPNEAPTGPLLVTGDEGGCVRIWDQRLAASNTSSSNNKHNKYKPKGCVLSWEDNQDYISGFDHSTDGNTLLASSADCTLSVFDLRKATSQHENGGKMSSPSESIRRSDDQEDELLSITVLKNGNKVVCGTEEGVLAVWSWNVWGDVSDRFPGHPQSIDAILKVDEDTILTGCSDGLIRLVQIHPDKLLGVLGSHEDFPVEKLQFNSSRKYVGSVSCDDALIRLWDAQMLFDDEHTKEDEGESNSLFDVTKSSLSSSKKLSGEDDNSDDEWEDMDDDEDMDDGDDGDDDSDDSDDEEEKKPTTMNDKRTQRFKSDNEKFFEDL